MKEAHAAFVVRTLRLKIRAKCSVQGCERLRYQGRKTCGLCYGRKRRNGNPGDPAIPAWQIEYQPRKPRAANYRPYFSLMTREQMRALGRQGGLQRAANARLSVT